MIVANFVQTGSVVSDEMIFGKKFMDRQTKDD